MHSRQGLILERRVPSSFGEQLGMLPSLEYGVLTSAVPTSRREMRRSELTLVLSC